MKILYIHCTIPLCFQPITQIFDQRIWWEVPFQSVSKMQTIILVNAQASDIIKHFILKFIWPYWIALNSVKGISAVGAENAKDFLKNHASMDTKSKSKNFLEQHFVLRWDLRMHQKLSKRYIALVRHSWSPKEFYRLTVTHFKTLLLKLKLDEFSIDWLSSMLPHD